MSAGRYRLALLTCAARGSVRYFPDAVLDVSPDGRIASIRPLRGPRPVAARGARDLRGFLALPGLIDAHCHASQYPAVASDGLELLPWLKRRIFPLEASFRGEEASRRARRFFRDMAAHGTTTACVYTSVWKDSTEVCFEEARAAGIRVIMGKVMMDRGSYDAGFSARREGGRREFSLSESEELCRKWHGAAGGRLLYAFTPRFALSCSSELMAGAARLARRYGAYVQTHLAENADEVRAVGALFPEARSYTDVYARAGLLGPKSLLAHSIWLKELDYRAIRRAGAVVVHCPTSNAFLASGIMDVARIRLAGIPLALGSDVAAGPGLCMFEVMRQAVYAQRLAKAHGLLASGPKLEPGKAFYMATLGAARALGLGARIGSLEAGKDADFIVVDPARYDAGFAPEAGAEDVVSRLVYRAGRFAVRAAFVAGKKVWGKL